jgi:cell division protein FtsB
MHPAPKHRVQKMKKGIYPIILLTACTLCSQPALAQMDLRETLLNLTKLMAQQQKELDEQREELASQRELIRQLQSQLADDEGQLQAAPAETVAQQPSPKSDVTAEPEEDQSAQEKAKDALVKQQAEGPESSEQMIANLQRSMNDPSSTLYDKDFPGAWYLPGTTAAMKIGGYVNLSLVNSFDPLASNDRFIVGSIPVEGQTVPGAVSGTSVSADQTRMNLEYREQTKVGEIRAFVEGDFRGNSGEGQTENFRLRHAFGQFRAFLAGKTWSTFMDVNALPEEVDVEGMNGEILLRHSQVRWSPQFGEKMNLKIALEDSQSSVINGISEKSRSDLVASLVRMPLGPLGRWNYRVGFILRDLKATTESNGIPNIEPSTDRTTGWGITTGGKQPVSWWGDRGDFFVWQMSYGKGIGRYINDLSTIGGGDAVFDSEDRLRALPVFAGFLSYQHIWPKQFKFLQSWPGVLRSNFSFGVVDINNFEFQDGSDYKRTVRASANLIYNPTKNVQLGIEFLWGKRENKDGSKGTATQTQFAARYIY